ncbi:hypothetical protein J3F83DRAFT_743700 [Trichoderma novae-zelandiae]
MIRWLLLTILSSLVRLNPRCVVYLKEGAATADNVAAVSLTAHTNCLSPSARRDINYTPFELVVASAHHTASRISYYTLAPMDSHTSKAKSKVICSKGADPRQVNIATRVESCQSALSREFTLSTPVLSKPFQS